MEISKPKNKPTKNKEEKKKRKQANLSALSGLPAWVLGCCGGGAFKRLVVAWSLLWTDSLGALLWASGLECFLLSGLALELAIVQRLVFGLEGLSALCRLAIKGGGLEGVCDRFETSTLKIIEQQQQQQC